MLLNQEGIIPLSHIKDKSEKWWTYWREYWNAKNNGTPYPKDYACEVTIPIKS
jgi:hypothetical protein